MDRLLSDVSDAAAMEVLTHFVVASYGSFGDYVREICREAAAAAMCGSLQVVLPAQSHGAKARRTLVVEVLALSDSAVAGVRFYMFQVFSSSEEASDTPLLRLELCVPFSRDENDRVVCVFRYIGDLIHPHYDVMYLDENTAPLWGDRATRARVLDSIVCAAKKQI